MVEMGCVILVKYYFDELIWFGNTMRTSYKHSLHWMCDRPFRLGALRNMEFLRLEMRNVSYNEVHLRGMLLLSASWAILNNPYHHYRRDKSWFIALSWFSDLVWHLRTKCCAWLYYWLLSVYNARNSWPESWGHVAEGVLGNQLDVLAYAFVDDTLVFIWTRPETTK